MSPNLDVGSRLPLEPRHRPRTRRAFACAVLLWLALAGCGLSREAAPGTGASHSGPMVLVTLEGLRADAVSDPQLTPALARLSSRAEWSGSAIAPSSWLVPALASVFSGLRPWQHQALHAAEPALADGLISLPEALKELGYSTAGFHNSRWLDDELGYDQGFDELRFFGRGKRAAAALRDLSGGRDFIWIHLKAPALPYRRFGFLSERVREVPEELPERIRPTDLERFFDPEVELPAAKAERLRALYRYNVAWADSQLGTLLQALDEGGQRDRTLLVVASLYGQEFGEHGRVAAGGSLGRELIEVPLWIDLPAGARPLAAAPDRRIALVRLWATLVEAAGGEAPPAVAASLFLDSEDALLSELYMADGANEFSVVDGDLQLRWICRFAPARGLSFRRLVRNPDSGELVWTAAFGDRLRAFERTLPLSCGGQPPQRALEDWSGDGARAVQDPQTEARLAAELRRLWGSFLDAERPPAEQARFRP